MTSAHRGGTSCSNLTSGSSLSRHTGLEREASSTNEGALFYHGDWLGVQRMYHRRWAILGPRRRSFTQLLGIHLRLPDRLRCRLRSFRFLRELPPAQLEGEAA